MGNIVEPYTLEELEKAPVDDIWGTNDTRIVVQKEAVAATIADNARLRALIKQAESVECYCPWCGSTVIRVSVPREWVHKADCPALTPEGEVK